MGPLSVVTRPEEQSVPSAKLKMDLGVRIVTTSAGENRGQRTEGPGGVGSGKSWEERGGHVQWVLHVQCGCMEGSGTALGALCPTRVLLQVLQPTHWPHDSRPVSPSCVPFTGGSLSISTLSVFWWTVRWPRSYSGWSDTHVQLEPGQGIKDLPRGAKLTGGMEGGRSLRRGAMQMVSSLA